MSTLVSINLHTLGSRRSAQKKSAKSRDDPEDLRQQRKLYENYLRKNKREKLLEGKRKVLEKLNWTVAWSDDEEDTEEGQLSVENLVTNIANLEASIKPMKLGTIASLNDHETNLNNLSHALDLCRKKLGKEVELTLGSTARFRKPVPGALASALSYPPVFEILTRILVNSNSSPMFSSCGLSITREVTAIVAYMTRFDVAIETLMANSLCEVLVESLQRTLRDVRMDLVCFYNSFNILNNIASSKQLYSVLDHKTLFGDVLFHLTRALTVYGPEDHVISLYIKSMTQLLTTIIQPLLKEQWFVQDQNFYVTFDQILSVLESFFNLKDSEVASNVMKVIAIVTETPQGLQLLFQRKNLITLIININGSYVDATSDQVQLKVVALTYHVIGNILAADSSLCVHFMNEKFFDQAYEGIKIGDFDIDYNVSRILLLVIKHDPKAFDLFFERKLTDYFTSVFFMSDNRTQLTLLDIVHHLSCIASPEQALRMLKAGFICITENYISHTDHGHETTHKVLQIHRNLLLKSVEGYFQEEAINICSSIKVHLEKLISSKNSVIAEEAVHLLDVYFDPPLTGSFPSPTSRRVH